MKPYTPIVGTGKVDSAYPETAKILAYMAGLHPKVDLASYLTTPTITLLPQEVTCKTIADMRLKWGSILTEEPLLAKTATVLAHFASQSEDSLSDEAYDQWIGAKSNHLTQQRATQTLLEKKMVRGRRSDGARVTKGRAKEMSDACEPGTVDGVLEHPCDKSDEGGGSPLTTSLSLELTPPSTSVSVSFPFPVRPVSAKQHSVFARRAFQQPTIGSDSDKTEVDEDEACQLTPL